MTWIHNIEDNPELDDISNWRQILAICIIFSFFSIVVVSSRLWIRYTARGLASDDLMAFLSLVFCVLYGALCIWQTRYGLGLVPADRPAEDLPTYLKVNFSGRPIYQLGISFFKIALLISYLRLFKGTNQPGYVRTIWIAAGLVFAGHLGCTLCLLFACDPVYKSWTVMEGGSCLPDVASFTGYAAVTIASDIAVTLIPLPLVFQLNISTKKKIGLGAVFVLGLFTTICSILRYSQIDRLANGDHDSTMLVVWGVIEFNVGNMCASLPFLAPVFVRKAKEYRSKYSDGDSGNLGYKFSSSKRDHYKLESVSREGGGGRKMDFASAAESSPPGSKDENSSEENIIIQQAPGDSIVKSVTYSVMIDEEGKTRQQTRPAFGV